MCFRGNKGNTRQTDRRRLLLKTQVATLSASDKNKTEIGFEVVKAKLGFSKNPGATAITLSAQSASTHLCEFVQLVQTQKTLNSFSSRSASFRGAGVREKVLSSPTPPSPPGAQLSGYCNLGLSSSSSATFWKLLVFRATFCILSNFSRYLPILRFPSGFQCLNWPFFHISQCFSAQFMNFL